MQRIKFAIRGGLNNIYQLYITRVIVAHFGYQVKPEGKFTSGIRTWRCCGGEFKSYLFLLTLKNIRKSAFPSNGMSG